MPRTMRPKADKTGKPLPPSRYQAAQDAGGRLAILQAVLEAGGSIDRAAELLGIGRRTLYREIARMGLADEISRTLGQS